jgi:hypothetical protein
VIILNFWLKISLKKTSKPKQSKHNSTTIGTFTLDFNLNESKKHKKIINLTIVFLFFFPAPSCQNTKFTISMSRLWVNPSDSWWHMETFHLKISVCRVKTGQHWSQVSVDQLKLCFALILHKYWLSVSFFELYQLLLTNKNNCFF